MRRFGILTAGAVLVLGSLAIPGMAVANGRTATPEKSTTISPQSVSLDTQFTAQGKGHGKSGYRKGYRRGYRHGYSDGRYGYYGHGYHGGGRCYGCDGPGSRCDRYGCAYGGPYHHGPYGGGYYGGGYGCGYDYPCSQPYQYDCTRYTGPDGKPAQDPQCKYDPKCDCYYHSSQPPSQTEPAPGDQTAQPAPDGGQAPAPDQGAEPAPGPDQGGQPRPY
jgi:hypothetical protein